MTVSVAIDLALDRLFTYEVPEALKEKLAVGQLLSVPFGHREARGFAMKIGEGDGGEGGRQETGDKRREGLRQETGDERLGVKGARACFALKPITAIVDETPFFSPMLLELVKRVAAYTASPIEATLKAALPAAVLKRNARAKEQLFVEVVEGEEREDLGFQISDFKSQSGDGCVAQKGVAQDDETRVGGAQDDETRGASCTARQRWLLEQLRRLNGGWLQPICRELKTTPASLRLLANKGLVKIVSRQKRRDPLAGRRFLPTKPLPLNEEQQKALEKIEGGEGERREGGRQETGDERQEWGRQETGDERQEWGRQETGDRRQEGWRQETGDGSHVSCLKSLRSPLLFDSRSPLLFGSRSPLLFAPRPVLLFGVTGSGKTEVYLQAIAAELAAGRGAIVLVPEIALTPQTVQRFASRFGEKVAVLHSALSDGERYDEWHRIRSGIARVVVGPRSAVWAPVRDLGLIVVDEEHEASYKQDELPRYHARDVAVLRGALEGARVVLGSATPSLESWRNVQCGKYALAELPCRAGAGRLPDIRIEDMGREAGGGGLIYCRELLEAIRWRLDRGEQTILLLNRRGYSRTMVCAACGWTATCPDCGMAYTYHQADRCLRCHVCGGWILPPAACPSCAAKEFDYVGLGTQRAEAALRKCFPRAKVLRMDADTTTRKSSHDEILSVFRRGEADILLGTQMIAKGLDFPNVTLVGVLNADAAINQPDFRAGERAYQLFAQVAGRAGRAELPGEVIIQTYDVESPLLKAVAKGDFRAFADEELNARRECALPPFCHLARIVFSSRELRAVGDWAQMYAKSLQKVRGIEVSDAHPCALEKVDGRYRWQVIVRAARVSEIVRAWRWIVTSRPLPKSVRTVLDMDAFNLS